MNRPDINNHPCFNVHAKGSCGRVHLPVAPDCNIKCNYCNRKYDCVNESRPGVTSSVLTPDQAVLYLERVLEKASNITVAGIAGPGDAFADPKVTMETLRLIRKDFLICSFVSHERFEHRALHRRVGATERLSCDHDSECRRPGNRGSHLRLGA